MKKDEKRQLDDNFIEQKIAEAFGYTEEKLAEALDWFMEEARKSAPEELKAPEGEFQMILERVERERSSGKKRRHRVRRLVKVMAAAAVLGTMVLGGGMWVGAKKTREYEGREHSNLDNVVVFDNSQDNLAETNRSQIENAYKQIEKELGIQVMEMSYLPENMSFYQLAIKERKSIMRFLNGNDTLFFYQGLDSNTSSLSYTSDMKEFERIYNAFLDRELPVYKHDLQDGATEFSIRIVENDYYYILEGIIDKTEFEKIVSGLKLYNN